jgi:hypothetical protein
VPRRSPETLQLGINYRDSSRSREESVFPAKIHAGDRAPDAPCSKLDGTSTRLFDIFRGPHLTLLAFGVCSVAPVEAVNQHYDSLVHALSVLRADEPVGDVPVSAGLRDTHGHAQRAYDPTEGMVILIRPDGYVGLIANGDSPSSVRAYLGYLGA